MIDRHDCMLTHPLSSVDGASVRINRRGRRISGGGEGAPISRQRIEGQQSSIAASALNDVSLVAPQVSSSSHSGDSWDLALMLLSHCDVVLDAFLGNLYKAGLHLP